MNFCCKISIVLLIAIGILSTLVFYIGHIVLDCIVLYNKNELWETISGNDYYYDALIEMAMYATVICILIFPLYFQCIYEGEWAFMVAMLVYTGLGVTGAAFTILCFIDINDSHCTESRDNVVKYVNNLDYGSYDGLQMMRYYFPYISNKTNIYDIVTSAQEWSDALCQKDYNTRLILSCVGCIGMAVSLLSPVIGIVLTVWFNCEFC